jgi:hypothetical protein
VPKVTIDFGDGRKLERTLTGNSIHYVLDSEGRVIDALPGLYGPQAFLRVLAQAEEAARLAAARTGKQRDEFLSKYHRARLGEISATFSSDLSKLGMITPPWAGDTGRSKKGGNPPTAEKAGRLAVTKMLVERPLLRAASPDGRSLEPTDTDATWARIAALHAQDARLDAFSIALIGSKNPDARSSLPQVVANLERSIAEDTARNEYLLHRRIYEWMLGGEAAASVEALNEKVYAELFLTPGSDPWLGLLPRDGYSGIDKDGVKR